MDCAVCGRTNRPGARFCGGCGRPLAPRCPACGNECQAGAQFCDACGAALAVAKTPEAEARKVVTIVFADLIGSTALHERLDAESARRLMDRYHRSMGEVVAAHGGTVMQLLGDGVLAGFGVPRVAEDDALRAVRAAVVMQRAFRALADEQAEQAGKLGLRVAVYTGEVVAGDDHTHVMGDPVNVAARLQQEARDGDVLLGESTRRLVADKVTLAPFGSFALKGRAEPVAAWRVVSLERPAGAAAIAFVGREDELRRIRAVYDGAVATRAARLAVVLGSPGLGKSRLIDEFTRRLGGAAGVLLAHCNAAGGATFAPLAEALRGALRTDDGTGAEAMRAAILSALPGDAAERERIASGVAALLAGSPASPEEIFFVVRRLLAALASERPVVLAIDDVQWAEPLLLDLVEQLVQWGSDVPLLILTAARPELRETRSSLATPGGLVGDVVSLTGLDAGAATRLAANAIGAAELPAAIAGRILATSEGNPLFVGELVRMLVQDGALRREGDRWTTAVELTDVEMPPTIHALLAARIERLRPEERMVLERAAVIGRRFSRAALSQLLPREIGDLDARLESLRRSELVEPDTGWFLGEPALRFHHVLIRDAAYRRLLKNTRAELHGRFADWLEARAAGAVEHDETLGWHLEQAHQHLRELGPVDAQGRALGERAARHLAAAGQRALARDDLTPAASLLERALARLDGSDPVRAELALDWCEAGLSAGDVATGTRAIAELSRFLGDSDRLRAWHTCFCGQLAVFTDPKALRASADAVEAAAAALASAGDAAGEAKAWSVHAQVLAQLGKIGACEAALDKALAAARRASDRRRANAVLAGAPVAALWGPSPVTRASGRCLDVVRVLRITQGAPAVEAVALRCQAVLETLRGRAEAARRMIASSRRMVEELGITQRVLEADLFAGLIELLEGDAAAAERCLRTAYDGLRAQELGIDAAQAAALLGRALLAQGRVAEAEAISRESESLAGDSFKAAIAWRGVRAEALAARGEHAAAIEFARAAVEIAAATDDLLDHADARQALAIALRAAGRSSEADAEAKRAIELWEAKGATLLAERARRGGAPGIVSPEPPAPAPARTARLQVPQNAGIRRRVRPNGAITLMERYVAAFAARDAKVLAALFADGFESEEHQTGAAIGREEALGSLKAVLRSSGASLRYEPLASLGESLGLVRRWWSSEATRGKHFDVAASETEEIGVCEVDEAGRFRRGEIYSPDHLGDAVVYLYERYAELLPDGPERARASATARSVAGVVLGSVDPDRFGKSLDHAIELTDHRTVKLFGIVRGAESIVRGMRVMLELAADVSNRVDDVLCLRSDSLLVRLTHLGTARASGDPFERQFLQLWVFGSDGLATRMEWFDGDRDAEALARCEELIAQPPKSTRRVRPNAATANVAHVDAAIAARDEDALNAVFADGSEGVDHTTGTTWDQHGMLATWRALLRSREPSAWHEPLATLGDSLALCRVSTSASGFSGRTFDVGAFEREEAVLIEVDARGRRRRTEGFAADKLGAAVARLYERYAELLPDGPERVRAAATARSVAVLLGPFDFDRWTTLIAPSIEFSDLRIVGVGFVRGSEAVVRGMRTLRDLVTDAGYRVDDLLALRSDALLVRWTHFGTDRASGGTFERSFCRLWIFGADGLITRWEQFDEGQRAEALARFDELSAGSPSPRFANASARLMQRFERCWNERDREGMVATLAPAHRVDDRRRLVGMTMPTEQSLASLRFAFELPASQLQTELLATRGERLALFRVRISGQAPDSGLNEVEHLQLMELDASGRHAAIVAFDLGDLAPAHAELDARYAAGEGLSRGTGASSRIENVATRTEDAVQRAWESHDWEAFAALFPAHFRSIDRRPLMRIETDRDTLLAGIRPFFDARVERSAELLATRGERLALFRMRLRGSVGGSGPSEVELLQVVEVDAGGLRSAAIGFGTEDLDAAYAELDARYAAGEAAPHASIAAGMQEFKRAFAERDWKALAARCAPDLVVHDRRLLGWETLHGPEAYVEALRLLVELAPDTKLRIDHVTICASGYLVVTVWEGSREGGAYEAPSLMVAELDGQGRIRRFDQYDLERLEEARARFEALGS